MAICLKQVCLTRGHAVGFLCQPSIVCAATWTFIQHKVYVTHPFGDRYSFKTKSHFGLRSLANFNIFFAFEMHLCDYAVYLMWLLILGEVILQNVEVMWHHLNPPPLQRYRQNHQEALVGPPLTLKTTKQYNPVINLVRLMPKGTIT